MMESLDNVIDSFDDLDNCNDPSQTSSTSPAQEHLENLFKRPTKNIESSKDNVHLSRDLLSGNMNSNVDGPGTKDDDSVSRKQSDESCGTSTGNP